MKYDDDFRAVAEEIAAVDTILIITGAGLSVDSGLPTFRGIGGLYEGKNTEDGMPIELALSGTMLRNCTEALEEIFKWIKRIGKGH